MVSSHIPSFKEAFLVWIRVALISFGGPAGQIAVMHRILVEEKGWISEAAFLHALNYCMLLPGPEAQQLATYLGWKLHQMKGGIVAGIIFIVPGFLSILILSILYVQYQQQQWLEALFYGLKPAVLAIVCYAIIRLSRKILRNALLITISVISFLAIVAGNVPFPVIIGLAAMCGMIIGYHFPTLFPSSLHSGDETIAGNDVQATTISGQGWKRALKVLVIGVTLWITPFLVIALYHDINHLFVEQGIFFGKVAMVTFGGAYAVLTYVAQEAVAHYGWLQPHEMIDGLAMAETTPGPLIQVVQFVGFMGAYRFASLSDPMTAAIIASFLVTWATFVPCFIWIFLGAPYIERLQRNQHLQHALTSITASVVGVIASLGWWFALHSLFSSYFAVEMHPLSIELPELSSLDPVLGGFTLLALFALIRMKLGVITVLALMCVLSMARTLL